MTTEDNVKRENQHRRRPVEKKLGRHDWEQEEMGENVHVVDQIMVDVI